MLTKQDYIALMYATVTGIDNSPAIWTMKMEKTQAIALDEAFTKRSNVARHNSALETTSAMALVSRSRSRVPSMNYDGGDEEGASSLMESRKTAKSMGEMEVPLRVMNGNGLCSGNNAINLTAMILIQGICSFDYAFIGLYTKYLPGDFYFNLTVSGVSEILGHIAVGVLYNRLNPKWTLFTGFAIGMAGGMCILFDD